LEREIQAAIATHVNNWCFGLVGDVPAHVYQLFAFDGDNIIQLRKVTRWENLFSFCSEKKNSTTSDRASMSGIHR
jgi:hypothetical protein